MVTVRRDEVRALRTAWSQLKDALYQENMVAPSGTLQGALRSLESLLVTAPGSSEVKTELRLIKICLRESKGISEQARTRMNGTVASLDRALEDVNGLPDRGTASLREDLHALQHTLPPGLPLSPAQDPAITTYRRDAGCGDHDHPVDISVNVSFLIRLTAEAEGLNTADIAEQLRDIALQLHCKSPSLPTLEYLTRKLYLSMRSKVDLGEPKYLGVSFELSQLMGAVQHMPAHIPSPFQIDLAASTLALAGRPRSTSTPARPTTTMPAPMLGWMALRKTLRTNTHIDKKTVGELMHLFNAAANKPLGERKAALDQAKDALHLALTNSDALDSQQASQLRTALTHYYQVQLELDSPAPSTRDQQQQAASADVNDLPDPGAREPARRNLTGDFAASARRRFLAQPATCGRTVPIQCA